MLLLPPHTHTLNGKERGREREGHAHLHPFAVSQVISGNSCSCTAAIGTGFGKGTVSVTGDWGRDLVEVFPAGLATSNIYKQIKFASEFHLSCFATIVCGRSLCVCVCVCAAATAAKLLGLPARVKVKLYLYLPVAKSEITSKMHAESARPWNDLQTGHICMRVPPYFIKYFHIRC